MASEVPPFSMRVSDVATNTLYFQSVFGLIQPSAELSFAHQRAVELFSRPDDISAYMPHVSLIYGLDSESSRQKVKEEVAKTLKALSWRVITIFSSIIFLGVLYSHYLLIRLVPLNFGKPRAKLMLGEESQKFH